MGKSLRVVEPLTRPDKDLVEALEDLLSQAKKGDLKAMAWVNVGPLGVVGTGWVDRDGVYHLLCSGCAVLLHRITDA